MKLSPFSRFVVDDHSMVPVYFPGDHVLTFNWMSPKENDVVVFKKSNINFIKRITKVQSKLYICMGDNKKVSINSYRVVLREIVGKVILKY